MGFESKPLSGAGSAQALDHAAQWVRFADTKATVLLAGLGAITTMVASALPDIIRAAQVGEVAGIVVGSTAAVAAGGFLFALIALLFAISPNRKDGPALNRFSWPSLVSVDVDMLKCHNRDVAVEDDAWRQTLVLARVAAAKFDACDRAIWGFGVLIVSAVMCLTAVAWFTR